MHRAAALAAAPVTTVILALTGVVFAVYQSYGKIDPLLFLHFSEKFGGAAAEIRAGQLWRVFTPALVHLDFFHWLFNSICFWQIGSLLERAFGSFALLCMCLVFGGAGNIGQYMAAGPMFGGLSGVLFGLLGFVWSYGRLHRASAVYMPDYVTWILLVFFFGAWLGLMGPMANMAHTMGLATGLAAGVVFALRADHVAG